jgi:hypothetical protein
VKFADASNASFDKGGRPCLKGDSGQKNDQMFPKKKKKKNLQCLT